MATTVQTILRSAQSSGSFVGVTLRTKNPNVVLKGAVKVQRITPAYVHITEYDGHGERYRMKVSKTTIRQVRANGVARNTRSN